MGGDSESDMILIGAHFGILEGMWGNNCFYTYNSSVTDEPTNQLTDSRTNEAPNVACPLESVLD